MNDPMSSPGKDRDDITPSPLNRRAVSDRRSGKDRRGEIRYELDRRKNHGRRSSDKDPWKDSLHD